MNRRRALDRRGFLALLRACKDRKRLTARRDYFLIYFAGRTGLRASELLATRVRDLSLGTDPAFVHVATLKQRRAKRDQVLLEPRTVKRARTYLRRVLPGFLGGAPGPDDPLFPSGGPAPSGELRSAAPMKLRNVSRIFAVYARRARLRAGVSFHSLRHFRGMTLYRVSGHDLEFTRQQLRHRHLSTTQHYLGVDPELERKYLDALDRRA